MTRTKAIRTEAEYREVLKSIESLMAASTDTPEGKQLDALVALVEDFESKQCGAAFEKSHCELKRKL